MQAMPETTGKPEESRTEEAAGVAALLLADIFLLAGLRQSSWRLKDSGEGFTGDNLKIRNSMLLDFCGTIFASLVTGLVCSTLMAALVLILTHSAAAGVQ